MKTSNKYVISYDPNISDWYVSSFNAYFHARLINENKAGIEFVSSEELAKQRGVVMNSNNSDPNDLYNCWNLIIFNKQTEKYFIHSWHDYSPVLIDWCMNNGINLVSFSCVNNVQLDYIIDRWKHKVKINPSVYYLHNWSDHQHIKKVSDKINRKHKAFFNGSPYGHRSCIMDLLNKNPFFDLRSKSISKNYKEGFAYFDEVSDYKFGLSLNGAAHICYRDLELFGLNVLNLRETFLSKTHNPIIKDVHYIELITPELLLDMYNQPEKATLVINEKIDQLEHFYNTDGYLNMLNEANKWFIGNVLPENQFKIIYSFLEDFTILD